MTPTELAIFIDVQKIKLSDLAEELGVRPNELSTCINGSRRNQRVREKLAQHFHKSVDDLFGPDHDAAVAVARETAVA